MRRIADKIRSKHQVSTDETEQVFDHDPLITFAEKGEVMGEDVYRALGRTDAGRYLAVYFIYKRNRKALPISVRDMTRKERRRYAKAKGKSQET